MKITRFGDVAAASSTSGTGGGTVGGDLGGGLPSPTVTGLQGTPVCVTAPTLAQVLAFDGTEWCPADLPASGLNSIADTITTITPVTDLTVPAHSLSGTTPNATLAYVTPTYGGQETLHTVAASGAAQTLNPSAGNVHDVTLTANCTISLGTCITGQGNALTIILRQDGTGSRTVTWPGSVSWVTGSAPTLKTAAAAVDVVTLFTLDGGTTWGGAAVGTGFSGGTPALALSTTNAAGSATTGIRTDATVAVFDATVPTTQAFGDSAATGSAAITARRDHKHGMPTLASVVTDTGAHVHVVGDAFTGDGATTVFYTSNGYQPGTLAAYSAGLRLAITETAPDVVTFGAAPANGVAILFDYLGAIA